MCGIAGVFSIRRDLKEGFKESLKRVGEAIMHRGPDDSGIWLDPQKGIGLVHRRLSIQDLSPLGAQPMESRSGRYTMVFNGEIYNFISLRAELEKKGATFRGHSDTEVMLAAFESYGVEESLKLFKGMFAIAVVDHEAKNLILARDRMGEKPLYYGWNQGHFVFASELKALSAFPFWSGEVNRDALTLLLRHNFIPAPHSIYQGIQKLPPATFLSIDLSSQVEGALPEPESFWTLGNCFAREAQSTRTAEAATKELDALLREVIGEQMVSDVPLGAFLSGGIDSSLVVSIMQQMSTQPVKTFTIGFNEERYNEAEHAKAVAAHLGTEHTELYITPEDALAVIPKLSTMYDEPFADSSQIPTHLVAEMTRRHVTVSLSGDGGDELFCGYGRYFQVAEAWKARQSNATPIPSLFNALPKSMDMLLARLIRLGLPSKRNLSLDEIVDKLATKRLLFGSDKFNEFYRHMISYWNHPESLIVGASEPAYSMTRKAPVEDLNDVYRHMMCQDIGCYLPDDILVKVDRAAMACSLETRVPLLDQRIVEFALSLPIELNVSGNQGKQVLRKVLDQYVPRKLIDRKKAGFSVPVGNWLRGELREWAESLLDESKLRTSGIWNSKPIRRKWADHLAGRGDQSAYLWGVLMFQAWHEDQ